MQPYAKRLSVERLKLQNDPFFGGASDSIMTFERLKKGSLDGGLLATVTVGVDPRATPPPVMMGGPPPQPRR